MQVALESVDEKTDVSLKERQGGYSMTLLQKYLDSLHQVTFYNTSVVLLEKELEVTKAALGGKAISKHLLVFSDVDPRRYGGTTAARVQKRLFFDTHYLRVLQGEQILNKWNVVPILSSLQSGVYPNRAKPANNVEYPFTLGVS